MATTWIEKLRSAQKTCLLQDGRKKVHFTFSDGGEMAEEYDVRTDELLVRKWRKKLNNSFATKQTSEQWEYEIGEQLAPRNLESAGLIESLSNPIFVRKDSSTAFIGRVRNLPFPIETYMVTVDEDKKNIVIRTTNKKYYKKFDIPDMLRAQIPLDQNSLSVAHANNTLIVSYKKPKAIIDMEKQIQTEIKKMKAAKDGDVDCTPS
ncbi:protein DPCD-like [Mytilus galloprovincialis]|uniref:protein DPCD-like n=1 Tax=Mytilus galloprovincialis TaxID=29158 RepID=UPI003F7C7E77